MIRRREDWLCREHGGRGFCNGGLKNGVGVTVSRCERILLLAQGHLSTSIFSSRHPSSTKRRRVYTPIKQGERGGEGEGGRGGGGGCSFSYIKRSRSVFVLVARYFLLNGLTGSAA